MLPNLQKPARGSGRLERRAKRIEIQSYEDDEKDKVRARDVRCRWPHCRRPKDRLEVAHLIPKGNGGDHGVRTRADLMIRLCYWHHQADPQDGHAEGSLERHNLRIDPLTALGTNGPCVFYREHVRVTAIGMVQSWVEVGREICAGVLEFRRRQ